MLWAAQKRRVEPKLCTLGVVEEVRPGGSPMLDAATGCTGAGELPGLAREQG